MQSRQCLIQIPFCTNACGTEGLGWRAIIVTVFYKAKDDPIIKQSAFPQNKEKTLEKIVKDRVRKLLDESNVIEINLSASFSKCGLYSSSLFRILEKS